MTAVHTKTGKEASASAGRGGAAKRMLVFELEEAVESVRDVVCRALAAAIKDADARKVEDAMVRFGLCAAPAQAARAVLAGLGVRASSHDAVLAAVAKAVAHHVDSPEARLRPVVNAAVQAFREIEGSVAVLSSLPEETARAAVARLGLEERGVALTIAAPLDAGYPGADQWLQVARSAGVAPCRATALVAARPSLKSAMIAGLRCIAAPDRFTAVQDFGGADAVFDGARNVTKRDVLEVL